MEGAVEQEVRMRVCGKTRTLGEKYCEKIRVA